MSNQPYIGKPRYGDAPVIRLDESEALRAAAQAEREAAFIEMLNARGGMPRSALVNGVVIQVNGLGLPWREREA